MISLKFAVNVLDAKPYFFSRFKKKQIPLFTILAFFLFYGISYGQFQNQVDSLFNTHIKSAPTQLKVFFLKGSFDSSLYNNPEEAKEYALEILTISKNVDYKLGVAIAHNSLGMYYDTMEKLDSASIHYQKSYNQNKIINNLEGITTAMHNMAIIEFTEGNYKEVLELIDKKIDLQLSAKTIDPIGLAQSHMLKGHTYSSRGDYNLALKEALGALRTFNNMNHVEGKAEALRVLSTIEYYLNNHKKSIEYALEALPIYKAENNLVYETLTLSYLGSSYYELKKYDTALELLEKSLKLTKQSSSPTGEADVYKLIGKVYIKMNNFQKGYDYLNKSLNILEKAGISDYVSYALIDIGKVFLESNKSKEALSYLDRAILLSEKTEDKNLLKLAFAARAQANENLANSKEAFNDLKTSILYKDSIFNLTTSNQIEELRSIYDTENKENQITILKQREEVSNLQRLLMGIGLLLSILGFYAVRQKMKHNRLEKENIASELAFKKKELTTHALHLAKKNEVLEGLKQKAEELKSTDKSKNGYQQLIRTINFDLQDDNNWENFARYFEEVHKDFNGNIKRRYPEVTSNELRLLALLKMNLSSKEIANILNISPEGIKKARYRLRKKLNITTEDSLQDLVLSL